ncbi:MAG: GntR family transcriptional regulator [Deltaproteobacteria bacterium]|nr:GntR family transcriptional regulator [Deltaproteobacteria bacterium]
MEKIRVLDHAIEKPLTLREKIVDFIKDSITSGRLKPGERVPEQEIAESFGISRTPIREAFRQLESEGFISFIARKGAVVSHITAKDVSEFYAIKSLLDGYAARLACAKFTDKEIAKLKSLNQQMEKCAEKNDVKGFFRLDNQFHDIFLKASGNEKLYALSHQIVQQFERYRITALSVPGRLAISVTQHKDIIKAFSDKNVTQVEALVRDNAEHSAEILVKELSKERNQNNGIN